MQVLSAEQAVEGLGKVISTLEGRAQDAAKTNTREEISHMWQEGFDDWKQNYLEGHESIPA